jgi:hypothetical protein
MINHTEAHRLIIELEVHLIIYDICDIEPNANIDKKNFFSETTNLIETNYP